MELQYKEISMKNFQSVIDLWDTLTEEKKKYWNTTSTNKKTEIGLF